jgi:hypothetical protein
MMIAGKKTFSVLSLMVLFTALSVWGSDTAPDALPGEDSFGTWTFETPTEAGGFFDPWIQPAKFREARLDTAALGEMLVSCPLEGSRDAENDIFQIDLPRPDGKFERFAAWESPMMEPGLAKWFVEQGYPMKTYAGRSLDSPGVIVRFDFGGPTGFHAWAWGPDENWFVEPRFRGNDKIYLSYNKADSGIRAPWTCELPDQPDCREVDYANFAPPTNQLRHYRLANAATGEYTAFHGGTVVAGQAAIVTSVNRVNQMYERDASIRMDLVANNNLLVYTNSSTDPYTNNNGSTMLGQNQTNITTVIGSANYDIGHVFSTGGGGIAGLGVVCVSGSKARGVTGNTSPVGDSFDIDYVAHEMGHQWGGNHSFNSSTSNCGGGNRNGTTAYEPGSGASIMAYAGICGADNLQSNSDADFHAVSLDEIINYSGGLTCNTNTADGNANAPTVSAGSSYTIPKSTPFELTALNGSDADGDSLTYSWEEWDLGASITLAAGDNGSSPIFRTWLPSTSPSRVFPRLSNLLANTVPTGEVLPTTSRTMNFRVIVRDNHAGGGRINAGLATMQVTSTTTSGPFLVTYPNTAVGTVSGTITVTWNVASTTAAPVSAANVDILLSTDGGNTWPTTLLVATSNDGTQAVTLPNITTSTARIKVKGSGNIFFDISNENFSIIPVIQFPPEIATGSSSLDTLVWTGFVQSWPSEGTATGYRLYRGIQRELLGLLDGNPDFCTRYDGPNISQDCSADDASLEVGNCYYYLVTAYNIAGEGSAGLATQGARQVNTTGTCP